MSFHHTIDKRISVRSRAVDMDMNLPSLAFLYNQRIKGSDDHVLLAYFIHGYRPTPLVADILMMYTSSDASWHVCSLTWAGWKMVFSDATYSHNNIMNCVRLLHILRPLIALSSSDDMPKVSNCSMKLTSVNVDCASTFCKFDRWVWPSRTS